MRLEQKSEELYRELSRELDNFPAGNKFYPVREIMTRFRCHRRVVDVVLNRMTQEGLIRREPYVGIFSCVSRKPFIKNILLAAPDFPSEENSVWFRAVDAMASQYSTYQVKKVFFDAALPFLSRLSLENVNILVAIRAASNLVPDDLVRMAQLKFPVVLLNTLLDDVEASTVCADQVHGGMLAADYLLRHGHRKLLVVVSEPYEVGDVALRVRTFCNFAALHGAEVNLLDCETCSGESGSQHAYDALNAYLSQHGADFTALFGVSDGTIPGILTALSEHGLAVPTDVSVIGFGGLSGGDFFHPPLTTVGFDRTEAARMMFQGLEAISRGEQKCFKIKVPMMILERASVATAKRPVS